MGVVYEMLKDTRLRCTQVLDFLLDDYTKDHTALDDQTICERIAGRPIKTDELLDLAIRAADAIDAAHAKGIVHLDIKPKNIFAMRPWQVKVLDLHLMELTPAGLALPTYRRPRRNDRASREFALHQKPSEEVQETGQDVQIGVAGPQKIIESQKAQP